MQNQRLVNSGPVMSEHAELNLDDGAATKADGNEERIKNSSQETTLVSEVATGLGMIRRTLPEAMQHIPSELVGVSDEDWGNLQALHASGRYSTLFESSFANGRAFSISDLGLRHRQPVVIEWCGRRKLIGDGAIPADLRIDHVYLVSCKYDSKNFLNTGPSRLFDSLLKAEPKSNDSWYQVVAPSEFQSYYSAVREQYDLWDLPGHVEQLDTHHRIELKKVLPRTLPEQLRPVLAEFCMAVSERSAIRWRKAIGTSSRKKSDFAMTLLRIPQAVYFLLGQDGVLPQRFKVLSRWDWANRFDLADFNIESSSAMQPTVNWTIKVTDRFTGEELMTRGHVEVRWSHGRFNGAPEAKVYFDSPLRETPGFIEL